MLSDNLYLPLLIKMSHSTDTYLKRNRKLTDNTQREETGAEALKLSYETKIYLNIFTHKNFCKK